MGRDQPIVGLLRVLDPDHLDVGRDPVLAAEVEHLLRLGEPADPRPGQAASARDQAERWHGERLRRCAHQGSHRGSPQSAPASAERQAAE